MSGKAQLGILFLGFAPLAISSPLHLKTLDGSEVQPLRHLSPKATVFFFISTDCPLSNAYAPETNRIESDYHAKGVQAWSVYEDSDLSIVKARKHAEEFGYHFRGLVDFHHQLARKLRATVTPEAVIVDQFGEVVYRGRIDNTYASVSRRRGVTDRRDLRDALTEISMGKKIKIAATTAIGCAIPTDD